MFTVLDATPMPKTGHVFRYIGDDKPYSLVTVIGTAYNTDGMIDVVFTEYDWTLAQAPVIYTLPLYEFTRTRVTPATFSGGRPTIEHVFKHEPDRDDMRCRYIQRAQTVEQRYIQALITIHGITADNASAPGQAIWKIANKALYPTKLPLDEPGKT